MSERDLLNPPISNVYVNQLRQTIDAYDPQHVVIGEALQNALDAIAQTEDKKDHTVTVIIDLPERTVTVTDDGVGFPDDPDLLVLGGTRKTGRGLYGMIGAGLKVVLFSSEQFDLKARSEEGAITVSLSEACTFDEEDKPSLMVGETFEEDDDPLDELGTELVYRFPDDYVLTSCFQRISETCIPGGDDDPLQQTLHRAVDKKQYPTRLAALLGLFLRRYTYVGDTRGPFGTRPGAVPTIEVTLAAGDGSALPEALRELIDDEPDVTFTVDPSYLTVEDTYMLSPPTRKMKIFNDALGRGGQNLFQTDKGFNHLRLTDADEFEQLLKNKTGNITSRDAAEFKTKLFPHINGISITVGRIPDFERCLPGGSRRVISANGVVTSHEINFDSGRNQQYVRCLDIAIDVDAKLNYGKTHLTDRHLVGRIVRYLNAAYSAVLHNAAANFVGKISNDDDDEATDVFLGRPDLGLDEFVLRKEPRSEQDVIALFFELAARGDLDGYRLFGLSSKDKYDARGAMASDAKPAPDVFDVSDERDLSVIEFKHTAADVIRDFDRGEKDIAEIKLLIAWTEGNSSINQYDFEDIQHSKDGRANPERVIDGVTRYIEDARSGKELQVLLLEPIVEALRTEQNDEEE